MMNSRLRTAGSVLWLVTALLWSLTWAETAGAQARTYRWKRTHREAPLNEPGDVLETRWSLKRSETAHDRIQLHRYRTKGPAKAILLYLPGTNMNGSVAVTDENHNLWLFLARRGVHVYALDYRTHFVPKVELKDTSFMRDWTLQAFVDDARLACRLAKRKSRGTPLFVAGFSRGATLAYALTTGDDTGKIAGLVVLDGSFKHQHPDASFDFAAALQKLEASGRFASDVGGRRGWDSRHALMQAAAADPSGPSPDPAFANVGQKVANVLYKAWGPGGLANAVDGISRVEILAALLDGYDRYYPTIQSLEGRAIASTDDDPRTELDDRWGELTLPVIYFGASGMGANWILDGIYSAAKSGSKDVSLHVLEGHGHLDLLVGEQARAQMFEPLLKWLLARADQRQRPAP